MKNLDHNPCIVKWSELSIDNVLVNTGDKWELAKPLNKYSLKTRFKAAWQVFIGNAVAIMQY